MEECIRWPKGWCATDYQLDSLSKVYTHRRVAIRGPHGLGKTTMAAWLIWWFCLTRDGYDWKTLTTASSWRQLVVYLWPEVHKWGPYLDWERIGRPPLKEGAELFTMRIKLRTGEANAIASNKHQKLEGAHAEHLLFVFDEAKAIPVPTWDAMEGAFSGAGKDTGREAFVFAMSTPEEESGRFYEIHDRKLGLEDWEPIYIKKEHLVAWGRMSEEWAEQRRRLWGETSAVYKNRILGEFASSAGDGVITLSWVNAAIERWKEQQSLKDETLARIVQELEAA